jgi:hypothetical protein
VIYGTKGAFLAVLPRAWTPSFVLVPSSLLDDEAPPLAWLNQLPTVTLQKIFNIAERTGAVIVRSSVVAETIWDRGTYKSDVVGKNDALLENIALAIQIVRDSTESKRTGIVLQSYVAPRSRGDFGNLMRVSKTRDQWELSSEAPGRPSKIRLNTQRDEAANPSEPLSLKKGLARQRLFGSVAAWLNSYPLRGRADRVSCEWVMDQKQILLVQLDREDEDIDGVNPFQIRISPVHQPLASNGSFLRAADERGIAEWDKLVVLKQLWEPDAANKPNLFYIPLAELPNTNDANGRKLLQSDFEGLIGPNEIIIRTSVRTGHEKLLNLARTEGLDPVQAAQRSLEIRDKYVQEGANVEQLSLIIHRFMAARACAWVRADPNNPSVEINSLWGLPDALQYCPYDIWEVHVPTRQATDYAEYKSNILITKEGKNWGYVRVKNELARYLSISKGNAIEITNRSFQIASRIGRACHIMWFVQCINQNGNMFNVPWYWTEAHDSERNPDRSNYMIRRIVDPQALNQFVAEPGCKMRFALELAPVDLDLMRNVAFINAVGETAKRLGIPVVLSGSTLAHAYFQLRRAGCIVLALGEKEHTRARKI